MTELFQELSEISTSRIEGDVLLSKKTTFKIGGPCDIGFFPETVEELEDALNICHRYGIPRYVMGRGSNLLADDEGFRGAVIFTERMNRVRIDGERVCALAGMGLTPLSRTVGESGLTGLEFACGIPGSVGGGIVMNAGAYNGELSQVVERCTVLRNGETVTCTNAEADFSYRHSAFLGNGDLVLEAVFHLENDSPEEIRRREEELLLRRREKQPLEYPSAGSAFKRPEGSFAAKLIDEAGLKGFSVGGAQVSEKHAGFIINRSGATSHDMLALFREVRDRVEKHSGIRLEPEVRYLSPKGEEAI
ncbi:MAG: UDP-N-acetylmuramate dehydrogenase [Clostridia bacterium]|nr:UDP-N-acetylmuramate dehydrogenase [Clostridia bacterium]